MYNVTLEIKSWDIWFRMKLSFTKKLFGEYLVMSDTVLTMLGQKHDNLFMSNAISILQLVN